MRLRIVLLLVLVVSLCVVGMGRMSLPRSGSVLASMMPQVNAAAVSIGTASQSPTPPATIGTTDSPSTITVTIVTGTDVPSTAKVKLQVAEVENLGGVQYSVFPSTSATASRTQTVDLSGGGLSTTATFVVKTGHLNENGGTIKSRVDIIEVINCTAGTPVSSGVLEVSVRPPSTASICTPSPIFLSWCSDYDWGLCACVGTIDKSPIVIDVDGNGFDLTDAVHGVKFDLNGDGIPDALSWTAADSDDAFLVVDRNANGKIDDGSELFGNFTPQLTSRKPNGFRALMDLDSPEAGGNGDMVLDSRDSLFSRLQLWQDKNHNGISEPEELHPLSYAGIKSLSLDFRKSARTDEHGNVFRYRARIGKTNHSPVGRWAWDVLLNLAQ
jgi:hypothetical protein